MFPRVVGNYLGEGLISAPNNKKLFAYASLLYPLRWRGVPI